MSFFGLPGPQTDIEKTFFLCRFWAAQARKSMIRKVWAAPGGWAILQKGGARSPAETKRKWFSMLFLRLPGPKKRHKNNVVFFHVVFGNTQTRKSMMLKVWGRAILQKGWWGGGQSPAET